MVVNSRPFGNYSKWELFKWRVSFTNIIFKQWWWALIKVFSLPYDLIMQQWYLSKEYPGPYWKGYKK